MENRFDQLTKTLAGEPPGDGAPVSRREALRKVGLGLVGALLASLGMGTAWGDPGGHGGGSGGGGNSPCGVYCRRFSTKAEQDHCLRVCRACASPTMLCGTNAFNLVCCSGA